MFKKNKPKIFCISTQRTGTTSVGEFFKRFNYDVAGWPTAAKNSWPYFWNVGNYEAIFSSKDFRNNQVFEDSPWWHPNFYKVLFHQFPNSQFILFTRDSSAWFQSMLNHSKGQTLGNTKRHCEIYRREKDFYNLPSHILDNYNEDLIDNLLSLNNLEEHYKGLYELRNKQIKEFFAKRGNNCLFYDTLENPQKWENLADFFQITLPENFSLHANKSL